VEIGKSNIKKDTQGIFKTSDGQRVASNEAIYLLFYFSTKGLTRWVMSIDISINRNIKAQNRLVMCTNILTNRNIKAQKRVSYFYRAAQLSTLAVFPPWGSSRGAGRKRLTPPQR